jgi:hypothetical protein
VAKRKQRRSREKLLTVDYVDGEGNTLGNILSVLQQP